MTLIYIQFCVMCEIGKLPFFVLEQIFILDTLTYDPSHMFLCDTLDLWILRMSVEISPDIECRILCDVYRCIFSCGENPLFSPDSQKDAWSNKG